MVTDCSEVARWLAEHDGVITSAQAVRLGATPGYLALQVRTGMWKRVSQGVYVARSSPATHRQALQVALAVAGPSAVVSHFSAAWLWELIPAPPPCPHILVATSGRPRLAGIVAHRSSGIIDAVRRGGFPCTDVLTTLIACAATVAPQPLGDMLDRAFAGKLIRLDRLAAQLQPRSTTRTRGLARLRAALYARGELGGPTPSMLESKAVRLMKWYGIALPKAEVVWGPDARFRLDFAFADRKLALEFHGAIAHASGQQQRYDHARENHLNQAGWTVLKYDWKRTTLDARAVAREIAEAYRNAGARH